MTATRRGIIRHVHPAGRLATLRISPEHYPAFASFCRQVDAIEAKELFVPLQ